MKKKTAASKPCKTDKKLKDILKAGEAYIKANEKLQKSAKALANERKKSKTSFGATVKKIFQRDKN